MTLKPPYLRRKTPHYWLRLAFRKLLKLRFLSFVVALAIGCLTNNACAEMPWNNIQGWTFPIDSKFRAQYMVLPKYTTATCLLDNRVLSGSVTVQWERSYLLYSEDGTTATAASHVFSSKIGGVNRGIINPP